MLLLYMYHTHWYMHTNTFISVHLSVYGTHKDHWLVTRVGKSIQILIVSIPIGFGMKSMMGSINLHYF